jgi:hypothetical protein
MLSGPVSPVPGASGIRLGDLPVQLREILSPFDRMNADGVRDGIIDLNELSTFSKEFKEFQAGSMPISVFSAEHQEKLSAFDADGGGKLDADVCTLLLSTLWFSRPSNASAVSAQRPRTRQPQF